MKLLPFLFQVALVFLVVSSSQVRAQERAMDQVIGVVELGPDVSIEQAATIGKELIEGDENFIEMFASGWALPKGKKKNQALYFRYKKVNAKFIQGEKLGDAIRERIKAKHSSIVRSYNISSSPIIVKEGS